MIARHQRWVSARATFSRCAMALVLLLALFICGELQVSCASSAACPPAVLSAINANYIARGAAACKGVPLAECTAIEPVKAQRLAEEKDAGCL